MRQVRLYNLIFLVILTIVSSYSFADSDLGKRKNLFKIDKIEIKGIKKVESEAILDKLLSKKGMMADNYLIRNDVKRIYNLKYFDFVEAHHIKKGRKNILRFFVKERPIVANIVFEGNDEFDDEDLVEKIKTKEYSILNINTIKDDLKVIVKEYEEKGYYLAKVDFKLIKNDDGELELHFIINEYDKVRVKKVTLLGNKSFPDSQLMSIMETREDSLFAFMSGAGNFKEFNFQTDIERLKYFYKTKGFLQVNVGAPQVTVTKDKKWVFISVKINEGPQFTVNDITFQGEVLFDEEKLANDIQIKVNKTYSEDLLRKDIQYLTEKYQDKGYAFANVLRTLRVIPGENRVDVEFSFEKGKIVNFGNIIIKGNTKTRDKVIRRELKIAEGRQFSGTALRKSKEGIIRLGFFEAKSVIVNTVSPPGKDNVLDVEITVKERSTGQISMGAGYSTANGAFFNASIAQNNFLGKGQNLSFSLTSSKVSQTFNLGFTEPYLFDSKWSGGFDIFKTENSQSPAFSYDKRGGDLRIGYPIFNYTNLYLTYKYELTKILSASDPTIDESLEEGDASVVKMTVVNDKRNNKFEPTGGHYLSIGTEFAGIGGEKKWLRNEIDARFYHKIVGDLVLRTRLFAAKLDKINSQAIPRSEQYSLGGPRNLRGFEYDAIGIMKSVIDPADATKKIVFNAHAPFSTFTTIEFEHPLAREAGLKWVVFFDVGSAGYYNNLKFHKDYGFGFRWFAPIGVLRFEWGYPIGEDGDSQFIFDIGQLF